MLVRAVGSFLETLLTTILLFKERGPEFLGWFGEQIIRHRGKEGLSLTLPLTCENLCPAHCPQGVCILLCKGQGQGLKLDAL
jgi:hypothetical protein